MTKKIKILIVEDSNLIATRLKGALSGLNNVEIISTTNNSTDAIEKFFEMKPEIVILDLMLKSGIGFEVLESIKTRSLSNIVIVYTNYSYPFINQSCLNIGADFFLDKSNDFEALIQLCDDIIKAPNNRSISAFKNNIYHKPNELRYVRNNLLLTILLWFKRSTLNLMKIKAIRYTAMINLAKMLAITILLLTGMITQKQLSQSITKVTGNLAAVFLPVHIPMYSLPYFNSLINISFKSNSTKAVIDTSINKGFFSVNYSKKQNNYLELAGIEIVEFSEIITSYLHSISSEYLKNSNQFIFPEIDASGNYSNIKYLPTQNNFSVLVSIAEMISEY